MLAKGVFVEDYMKLSIREYDVPEPKAGEVMIKTCLLYTSRCV